MAKRSFSPDRYDRFEATSRAMWRDWLVANHETTPGIWLVTYKRNSTKPQLNYADAVEEALCFGWIDSQAKTLDDERLMQLYTPRRKGSGWSRVNKQRLERLLDSGLMHPAGLARIEAAKQDGSWTLLDAIEDRVIPDDLAAELAQAPAAGAGFQALSPSAQKQVLWWVVSAKRPETRANRIERVVTETAAGRNPLARPRDRA